ncbi:MAG: hypothetical protein MZV65_39580 [Chromatiales bacterium]|nr:hypothetical protein [Chromatiales bacterium]MCK7581138.1 hypothetical protein [Chromatiales bacterium]
MTLKQIAETLAIPLPVLMTGRQGKPALTLIQGRKDQQPNPAQTETKS